MFSRRSEWNELILDLGLRQLTCSSSAPASHVSLMTALRLRLFRLPGAFPGDFGLLGDGSGDPPREESTGRGDEA